MNRRAITTTTALLCALLTAAPAAKAEPPSPPALTGFIGYLEWMLDLKVTQAQLDEASVLVARAWETQNEHEMKLVTRATEFEKDLANYSQLERDRLRSSVEDEYFKTLRRRGNGQPLALWIDRLRTARKPIAAGPPPLTRQASDALAELVQFVLGEQAPSAADKASRDTFAKALATAYRRLSPEQRSAVASAPSSWARVRAAPAPKRDELRQLWRDALLPAVDVGTLATASDSKSLTPLAHRVAQIALAWN